MFYWDTNLILTPCYLSSLLVRAQETQPAAAYTFLAPTRPVDANGRTNKPGRQHGCREASARRPIPRLKCKRLDSDQTKPYTSYRYPPPASPTA